MTDVVVGWGHDLRHSDGKGGAQRIFSLLLSVAHRTRNFSFSQILFTLRIHWAVEDLFFFTGRTPTLTLEGRNSRTFRTRIRICGN